MFVHKSATAAGLAVLAAVAVVGLTRPWSQAVAQQATCPLGNGWSENLGSYLPPNRPMPTEDTANVNAPDCAFHQWSWEAFVWATALIPDSSGATVPRFMTFATPADLTLTGSPRPQTESRTRRPLRLAARSNAVHGTQGFSEGAGSIVEADGNMLVSQNGYPVYGSVHMNPTYFTTANANLIATGAYQQGDPNQTFNVGDAVFKATWLRLDPGQPPPAGAYTTQAEVPVLQTIVKPGLVTIEPVPGQFTSVTVALVGLHVVGNTVNHPEFLWGTFEHVLNTPSTADNTFTPSPTTSSPTNYTFYAAKTPYSAVNVAASPPSLTLNATTQKLSPPTNAVQENATGGENQPNGASNVAVLNQSAQTQIQNFFPAASKLFSNYKLIGTVWMAPNSYNLQSNQNNAVGSISLANTTAETFFQTANSSTQVQNCFTCHNPTSYSFQTPPPAQLPNRLVALSHVLAYGSIYEVPNSISGKLLLGARPR